MFDNWAPNVRPDPRTISEIQTLRNLIGYMRDDLIKLEAEIEQAEARNETRRRAIDEIRNSTIPRYEERIEQLMEERDYGLRSDTRPVDTKSAPGAHNAYR